MSKKFFVICERDAGMFSLIQQVISNLPRALNMGRIPVVCFGPQCCYWKPGGHRGADTVWEYFFEPLIAGASDSVVPREVREFARASFPDGGTVGRSCNDTFYVSNNFGDHPQLRTKVLVLPFKWTEPDEWVRSISSQLMDRFIRIRPHLQERAGEFAARHFSDQKIIGVHVRGTDALNTPWRRSLLNYARYETAVRRALLRFPAARVFVATDDEQSLEKLRDIFGSRVLAMPAVRHQGGPVAGSGPTGALMPAYIAKDPELAVRNAEDALVEWLLLLRCRMLIHNGSSLARTVILRDPTMEHVNTHLPTWWERVEDWRPQAMVRGWHARWVRERTIRIEAWKKAGLW